MYYKKMLTGVNAYYSEGKNRGDKFPKIPYENGGEDPKYYIALDKAISISERINIIVNKWGKCRLHIDNTGLQKILKIFKEKSKIYRFFKSTSYFKSIIFCYVG
jgi:hypothetical protein